VGALVERRGIMVRKMEALLLAVCLGMLLTIGASAQEPPGNQQVQWSAVRDFALVAVGLLGGWGGAFISGWWSNKNLAKQLGHEAEQNRLSREEQRQQLTIQLIGQHQMLRDQLGQQTRAYMRDYRQQRVNELLDMIVAYDTAVDKYESRLKAGEPVPRFRPGVEPRLAKAALFVGETALGQKAYELIWAYDTLLGAIEKNPSDVPPKHRATISDLISELSNLAEEYIASG